MIGTKIKKYENMNKYGAKTSACKECQMNLGQIRHIPAGTDKKFMYLKNMQSTLCQSISGVCVLDQKFLIPKVKKKCVML